MHVYKDYIQKVKFFAGRNDQNNKKKHTIAPNEEYSKVEEKSIRSSSAQSLRPTRQNPSYYYSNNL